MSQRLHKFNKWIKGKAGLSIIIIAAALLIVVVSGTQYFYMRSVMEEEIERNAETALRLKAVSVKGMLNHTESLIRNYTWDMEYALEMPDSIYSVSKRIVEINRYIVGTGVVFIPDYFPDRGRLFEPWAYRDSSNAIKTGQMASERHDYTEFDFYGKAIEQNRLAWSEPYFDSISCDANVTTLMSPIRDSKGRIAGGFGIDLSLQWIGDTINSRSRMPSAFCLLLSETGNPIALPGKNHVRSGDFDQVVRLMNDSTVEREYSANKRIEIITFESANDGKTGYIYYAYMKGQPHWRIAIVYYDDELYSPLNKPFRRTLLALFIAFALLGFIIWRFSKNSKSLLQANIEKERIDGELSAAQKIQREMLPADAITSCNAEVAGKLLPARQVGGDLYDFVLRDDKLFFCIGDVSGKGVASALIMAVAHSHFRAAAMRERRPARIVKHLNNVLCQGNETNMFMTLFIGVLDLPTGRLRYCNAGHDAPLLINESVEPLPVVSNLPVGVMPDWDFEEQETKLQKLDTLLLYTDGVTEAMNESHLQYGMERLIKCCTTANPAELLDLIVADVRHFSGDAEQSDDLTMLAIRYTPQQEPLVMRRTITITNELQNVPVVNTFIKEVGEELSLDRSLTGNLQLALEEVVVNIISYAYPEGKTGDIDIDALASATELRLVVSDSGKVFAPTEIPDVDTTLSAEYRQIGGLGIFLVRQLMDSINYERVNGKNVLTLRKTITKTNNRTNDNENEN